MSNIKRVFYYLVSLISLGILAAGIRGLLYLVMDLGFGRPSLLGRAGFVQQQLSLGLAMLLIGGPLWFFFWRSIQRSLQENPAEVGASLRKLYLNLIMLVTALVSLFNLSDVISWLLGSNRQTGTIAGSLATLIVTGSIWFYHWKISEGEGHPSPAALTLRRWCVYSLSAWGLIWLTVGVVQLTAGVVLFLPFGGTITVSHAFWSDAMRQNAAWIILGGAFWAFHWFHMAKDDVVSTLRQVYIYLLAIVVSSIAGLTALIVTLYQTLVWILGANEGSGAVHFQFLGWTIPTMVVAAAVWTYHQYLSREEANRSPELRLSSKRIHLYIMSFLGLGAGITGLITLLGVLISLLINALNTPLSIQSGWWQRQLSFCLAFLAVAIPLWWFYWQQIVKLAARGGLVEWRARSRRIYLYFIVGATIITLAADLVNIIYQILNGGLTGSFNLNILRNAAWSIQSAIIAAPVLVYHLGIIREDQRRGAEAVTARKTVSLMAGANLPDLIKQLEPRLGARVRALQYSGQEIDSGPFSEEDLVYIIGLIGSSSSPEVLIIMHLGKALVLPYHELQRQKL